MSSVTGANKKDKARLFEMVLSSPGMNENCRIGLKITRQNALLLCRLIEAGMLGEKNIFEDEFLTEMSEATISSFKDIHIEILKKAGLTDFYDKLKTF